jgi:hypothetical protein
MKCGRRRKIGEVIFLPDLAGNSDDANNSSEGTSTARIEADRSDAMSEQ